MSISALIYHDVVNEGEAASSGFSGAAADSYKLTTEEFRRHTASIAKALAGRMPLVLTDGNLPVAAVGYAHAALTFDDGGIGAIQHAADAIEKLGWRGNFFIATDYIGTRGFLTASQIQDLFSRGHAIGSHSASHPTRMSACSDEQLRKEWGTSIEILSNIVGKRVVLASVPGGYYSMRVAQAAAAEGVGLLMTSEPTTRVREVLNCKVVGRFSVTARTSAAVAARLALGDWFTTMQQATAWNTKKVLKRLGGKYWLAARAAIFERVAKP